jgi:hypothetical protein
MKVYIGNREPTLDELLDDPIARLLMASDQLAPETVRGHFEAARRRLRELVSSNAADRR